VADACTLLCNGCPAIGEPPAIPVSKEAVEALVDAIASVSRGGRNPGIAAELAGVFYGLLVRGETSGPEAWGTISPAGLIALDQAVQDLDLCACEEEAHGLAQIALLAIPAVCRRRVLTPAHLIHEDVTRAAVLVLQAQRELALCIRGLGDAIRERCGACRNSGRLNAQICTRCATNGGADFCPIPPTPEQRRAANPGRPTVQMTHEEALANPPEGLFDRAEQVATEIDETRAGDMAE
jgi:hypothetical protein